MGMPEDEANQLAIDTIKYIDATGDESIVEDLVKVLGASSQTAEEAFKTAMRVRRANIQARALILQRIAEHKKKKVQAKSQKLKSLPTQIQD